MQMNSQMKSMTKRNAILLAPAMVIIAIFMILPLCVMLVYSFLEPGTYGGVIWSFSIESYIQFLFERDMFDNTLSPIADYLLIFARSIMQAFIATTLCIIVGFPTAYFIVTRPDNQKSLWLFLITIPYWVNLLIRTVALLFVLRDCAFRSIATTDSD